MEHGAPARGARAGLARVPVMVLPRGWRRDGVFPMIVRGLVVLAVLVSGLVAPPAHAAPALSAGTATSTAGVGVVTASALAAAKPRAAVTGSAQTLGSGKVRVSVTSNAKKVKVAYRTAKNKKRTATITIRKGKGARTLAGDPRRSALRPRRPRS